MATMMTDPQQGFRVALGRFAAELPRTKGRDRINLVGQLRRLALANELHGAAEVVDGMAEAITREDGSAPIGPWLAAIDQAASCGGPDSAQMAKVILASVGVRYAY